MVSLNPLTWFKKPSDDAPRVPGARVDALSDRDPFAYAGQQSFAGWDDSIYDGSKFAGGFGETQLFEMDYWTLRARSAQLYRENLYARGLLRRLVTNEINTGLTPEAMPDEVVLGVPEDSLNDWTENIENRFILWGKNPDVCDFSRADTFGALQRTARREALIEGDVLVVMRQNPVTRMPNVQLVKGSAVTQPVLSKIGKLRKGHTITHGVERDASGRRVAFWVRQADGEHKRLAAYGEKSGRRLAWLVYGTDKRMDDVRGEPLLSIILQSLKEIDRYRDAAQRKAVINSILAMFIKKGEDKMGTLPVTGGAIRKGDTATQSDATTPRRWSMERTPGVVFEELQQGEEPVGFGSQGTDVSFGPFEEAMIQAIAWANEIPPEILRLAFSNNYSASQAAINEFKIYLNLVWSSFGETFCTPIYIEWMISEALLRKFDAPNLLNAWRDPTQYDIFGAWVAVEWYGSIKPSTDMLKQAKGSILLTGNGWSTNAREARVTTGTKFSKNVKRLRRENEQLAEALRPMMEMQKELAEAGQERAGPEAFDSSDLEAFLDEYLEDRGAANAK